MSNQTFTTKSFLNAIFPDHDKGKDVYYQGSRQMTSTSRRYYEKELGAGLGPSPGFSEHFGYTEPLRRFIQREGFEPQANEIPNEMPSWMPGEDYYTDFKKGDPYIKVDQGFSRLPGAGYAALHRELEGVDPEDYPDIHKMAILADVAPYSREYNQGFPSCHTTKTSRTRRRSRCCSDAHIFGCGLTTPAWVLLAGAGRSQVPSRSRCRYRSRLRLLSVTQLRFFILDVEFLLRKEMLMALGVRDGSCRMPAQRSFSLPPAASQSLRLLSIAHLLKSPLLEGRSYSAILYPRARGYRVPLKVSWHLPCKIASKQPP